jgi:hypothetical protein
MTRKRLNPHTRVGLGLLVACAVFTALHFWIEAQLSAMAHEGFELSGQLQACESRATDAPCYTIDGKTYLTFAPEVKARSIFSNLEALEGRQVVVTVHAK